MRFPSWRWPGPGAPRGCPGQPERCGRASEPARLVATADAHLLIMAGDRRQVSGLRPLDEDGHVFMPGQTRPIVIGVAAAANDSDSAAQVALLADPVSQHGIQFARIDNRIVTS